MNLETLSGLYQTSKGLLRLLNHPLLDQQLKVIISSPEKLKELSILLDHLDDHVRVVGLEEVLK